jgi:hypothetical protein
LIWGDGLPRAGRDPLLALGWSALVAAAFSIRRMKRSTWPALSTIRCSPV